MSANVEVLANEYIKTISERDDVVERNIEGEEGVVADVDNSLAASEKDSFQTELSKSTPDNTSSENSSDHDDNNNEETGNEVEAEEGIPIY